MRWGVLTGPDELRLVVEIPETRRERRRGLLGRASLPAGRGLLIPRARSVHTVGMRFPIRVALLDRELKVRAVRRIEPGRVTPPRLGVRHVLELAGDGPAPRRGDRLRLDLA